MALLIKQANESVGLLQGVPKHLPQAHHRFCMRHLTKNVRSAKHSLSKDDVAGLYTLARSVDKDAFAVMKNNLA